MRLTHGPYIVGVCGDALVCAFGLLFKRLKENGVKCKRDKCSFGKSEVEYLGHIISASGIRIARIQIRM